MSQYLRSSRTIQHRTSDFTLSIFGEDYIRIGKLVSKIPHAETGGNLFGLWTNQGNAVVLVATGPGKNCKRTSASFYQDIPYMQRVGDLVTQEYPLCHIGEWHSHHRMQLYEPSYGDCNTVQRNYPRGSQGFVLMIANILQDGTVKLSPYKFIDERSPYKEGRIEVLAVENPFMKVEQITRSIKSGKEVMPQQQLTETERERQCHGSRDWCFSKSKPKQFENRGRRRDESYQTRPTSRSRSRSPIKTTDGNSSPEEERHQRRRNGRGAIISEMPASSDKPQQRPTANNRTTLPIGQEHFSTRNLEIQWYNTDKVALKETLEFVTSLADDPSQVEMTRDKRTLNLTTKLTHHGFQWLIIFPCDFPWGTVQLKKKIELDMGYSYSVEGVGNIRDFKNSLERTLQDQCTKCKWMASSKDVLPSPQKRTDHRPSRETRLSCMVNSKDALPSGQETTDQRPSRETRLSTQWYEIYPSTLEKIIDFVTSLDEGKATPEMSRDQSTMNLTLGFTHHGHQWAVEFPPNFPGGNVNLTKTKGSASVYTRSYPHHASYSYTNQYSLICSVKAGDVNMFIKKLRLELGKSCEKCRNDQGKLQFSRYIYKYM